MTYTTAENVAKWFLVRNEVEETVGADGISNLKLQKLLYYAQGCTLALTDNRLFDDDIVAWEHGPVVAGIYRRYRSYGSGAIEPEQFDDSTIPKEISNILEDVYQNFGQFSAWKLRDMTHAETPWKTTPKNDVISTGKIKKYFKEHYIEEDEE